MAPNSEVYNKDELEPPQWLNDEFFTKVLRSSEKDETIKLKEVKISPATVQGDHYASVMFRARVDYESAQSTKLQSISMILKTMPETEGNKKELLEESFIMETEIGMYTEVIPKFEKILRSIGDESVLGARCLYHSLSPKKLIIFEDLVPLGYTVLRDRQVNIEEARLAYLKLAKLHAISYKLLQENPTELEKFCHSFWHMPNISENEFITGGIGHFIELLETQPSLRKYKPHFEAIRPDLLEKCIATFREYQNQPEEQAHYVLCHGDFHSKNMMFRGNEDVMLLDYQMSYVGPMVNDVIYSIFMLLDDKLRKHHLKELIHFYFSNFVDTLQRIGYEGKLPKLIEFWQMMLKHKHWEIFLLTTFLPMWYGFREGKKDPDEMMNSADYRQSMYLDERYIAELEELIPKYLHMGYLDN